MLLWPCIEKLGQRYPNLVFEIDSSHRLYNIVTEGFDADIRLGEQIEQDMIAVRINPKKRMAVVGSPDYFAQHAPPLTPHDLTVEAALKGFGLTCVLDDAVQDHLQKGRLIRVLEDWCPPFPGYYLYYPTRATSHLVLLCLLRPYAIINKRYIFLFQNDYSLEKSSLSTACNGTKSLSRKIQP